ncbi:MAG: hypothetical protein V4747_08595 [Pseudomonadota bacterium]
MPDDKATGQHSTLALEDMAVATSGDYRHFVLSPQRACRTR